MVVAPIPPSHFGSSKSSVIASAMCLGVYIENSPRIGVRFAPVHSSFAEWDIGMAWNRKLESEIIRKFADALSA
jgi:hypothetical protein